MENAWGNRPWAEDGDKSENDLFAAVGKALSHWELLEQAIASLFTLVTVGSYFAPSAPALRAYSSVISSNNRIQMVRAAVESWLQKWKACPLGENVLGLLNECGGGGWRANAIAHAPFCTVTSSF